MTTQFQRRNFSTSQGFPSLMEIETILSQARTVFINQIQLCSKTTLIQSKEIATKNKNASELLSQLLLHSTSSTGHPPSSQSSNGSSPNDWQILTFSEQSILDLPPYLQEIYTSVQLYNDLYYCTLFDDVNGFWYALLAGLDSSFIGRTRLSQLKYVTELKLNMMNELHRHFEPLHYRGFGFVKSEMMSMLQQNDLYNACLGHYCGDFLNLNLVVLNEKKEINWLLPYCDNRVTLVLFREGIKWGSVIHPDNKSHLLPHAKEILESVCTQGDVITWEKNSHKETDVTVLKTIRKELKLLKIKDLSDKAEKLEIALVDVDTGKKKIKERLLKEVFTALTGQELLTL